MKKLDKQTKIILIMAVIMAILAAVVILGDFGGGTAGNSKEDIKAVRTAVEDLYNKNAYIQLNVGQDEVIYMLYNDKKEAIAQSQSGGKAIYRSDDKVVSLLSSEAVIDTDLSALRLVEIALDGVDKGLGTITSQKGGEDTDTLEGMTEYNIKIDGRDNIYKVYSAISDEYGAYITNSLFSGEDDSSEGTLTFTCSIGENGELGIRCFIDINGTEFNSWYFDGYLAFDKWELEKSWYVSTADGANWDGLILELDAELQRVIESYADKNNIDLDGTDPNTGSTSEGATTTSGPATTEN